ncbi:MAG: bifunctional oligoribonuclease/PAP phosphatase NrnA [Candidatus Eisenbacteria bacterium]|nr:bifunctional oligoribonuclease/PAP phosphatase NrnA [Candidatus Eisenbacteria bacterium]
MTTSHDRSLESRTPVPPDPAWTTRDDTLVDWQPILDGLDAARSIVITSHVNPDGDALGSELGLARWLDTRGHAARIVNADPVPDRYDFLDRNGRVETLDPTRHATLVAETDLLVVVDVSRWDRIGRVGEYFDNTPTPRLCIDHHPGAVDFPTLAAVVAPSFAATGELIVELMAAVGDRPDRTTAEALYVAIMTDTGSFRHASTTPRTHRIAAELLATGIDPSELYDLTWNRNSETRMRVIGEAYRTFKLHASGALVVASLSAESLRALHAKPADTEGLAELLRGVAGCRASAVFTEMAPGEVKVSLRSRGAVDVNAVARQFGGGGHVNAAGIPATGSLNEVRDAVVAALESSLAALPA